MSLADLVVVLTYELLLSGAFQIYTSSTLWIAILLSIIQFFPWTEHNVVVFFQFVDPFSSLSKCDFDHGLCSWETQKTSNISTECTWRLLSSNDVFIDHISTFDYQARGTIIYVFAHDTAFVLHVSAIFSERLHSYCDTS